MSALPQTQVASEQQSTTFGSTQAILSQQSLHESPSSLDGLRGSEVPDEPADHGGERFASGDALKSSSSEYKPLFKSEDEVDAYLAGKKEIRYVALDVRDDDLPQAIEDEKQSFSHQIFEGLLRAAADPPETLPSAYYEAYKQRQAKALRQCETLMGTEEDAKYAIARCDKLYYAAVHLHTKGVPENVLQRKRSGFYGTSTNSGYAVDWTLKFTTRMAKVIALVGYNKRVAFDVLTAELEAT